MTNQDDRTPFNPAAHEHLLTVGYMFTHYPASWCEAGDPENGPDLDGHPAVDIYTDQDSQVMISETGTAFLLVQDDEPPTDVEAGSANYPGAEGALDPDAAEAESVTPGPDPLQEIERYLSNRAAQFPNDEGQIK